MPAKNLLRKVDEGIFSHIYNKGVEERIIFNDQEDYQVFLGYLKDYLTLPRDRESTKKEFTVKGRIFRGTPHLPKNYLGNVELIAYNLMPDHFHLLLYQKTHGSIQNFIRSLCTRYSMYFNKKYQHTGALFKGPYKSVEVKDEPSLLHLTRYLHQTGDYSSYPEYLGKRESSWVKPSIILSLLNKGIADYKDFVEKYLSDGAEKEFIKHMVFEDEIEHLARRVLASTANEVNLPPKISNDSSEKISLDSQLKPLQRIPEILATVVIFLLLISIGITNMMIYRTNSSKSLTLGIATTSLLKINSPKPSPTPVTIPTPAASSTPIPEISKAEEISTASAEPVQPKTMVTVTATDGSTTINIREKATIYSKKIGNATEGDTFEFVSMASGWYEVKLTDDSIGFISAKYIKK